MKIGYNAYKDEPVYYNYTRENVVGVAAKTMYGKSVLLKILAISARNFGKHILIIDYCGEHKSLIYPNFNSKDSIGCIPDLKIIEDFGYKISDFDDRHLWAKMGFPQSASIRMAELCKRIDIHQNNPQLLYDFVLNELETLPKGAVVRGVQPIHTASKDSILTKLPPILSMFITEAEIEDGKRIYIKDWGDFILKHKNVLVNFNLHTRQNIERAQVNCGKILDDLQKYLGKLNLSIFIEECDVLAPFVLNPDERPFSLEQIALYSKKLQKFGVELFLFTQTLNSLSPDVSENIKTYILGRLNSSNEPYYTYTQGLRWQADKNYRQFLMVNEMNNLFVKFYPVDCPCDYIKR